MVVAKRVWTTDCSSANSKDDDVVGELDCRGVGVGNDRNCRDLSLWSSRPQHLGCCSRAGDDEETVVVTAGGEL